MCRNLNGTCSQVNTTFIANAIKGVNNLCMQTILDRVEIRIRELGLSWADFARRLDTTDQRVYNWRKRGIPKSEVVHIAHALGCSTDWLLMGAGPKQSLLQRADREAAKGMRRHGEEDLPEILNQDIESGVYDEPGFNDSLKAKPDELEFFGRMDAWDSNTPLGEDEVELPLFREVELAAGGGATQVIENRGAKLRFAKSTLSRAGVPPEAAACAFLRGHSMHPVMPDGTCVGVNTADTAIRDGEIYAIDHGGMLRIKYLHRRPGGGIRIVSQNSAEFPTEELTAEEMAGQVRVIGRVFWWSVLR